MPATHDYAGISANEPVKTFRDLKIQSFEDAMDAIEVIRTHRRVGPRYYGASVDWPLASNVYLREVRNDALNVRFVAVVLYATEIVHYRPDGTFSVDNGGHNTPTTASRVTQFTPDGYWFHHHRKQLVESFDINKGLAHRHRLPVRKVAA